jgi:hypothetical protein
MAYSQGGLIAASDYNGLVGSSPSSTINTVNTVWAVGSNCAGYGQAAISQVSSTNTVTATQWATLINNLNSALIHQSGTGSGISAVTSGQKINYLSTLTTGITTAYTNRLLFNTNAAAVLVSNVASAWTVATTTAVDLRSFGARAAFASPDQARYFFNAGGRLKFNVIANLNASSSQRSVAAYELAANVGGVGLFAANTNAGRLGAGGTLNTNSTTNGYYTTPYNANTNIVVVTSLISNYPSDKAWVAANINGTTGSNNDKGSNVDFWFTLSSTAGTHSTGIGDDLGLYVTRGLEISYPETTNISNTWGAVTVTAL